MKKILFSLLKPTFGSKKFKRFYEVMKNISLVGLNYRNTNIKTNGELFLIKTINKHYKRTETPIVIFDVGANIGDYTKKLNTSITCPRNIYSFEPFSSVFRELNSLKNNINSFYPFCLGFSDTKQVKKFFSSSDFSEVGGLYNKDFSQFGFSLNLSEDVQFDTIDDFCNSKEINHIDLLKVDVEGHDFFVLKGASTMLTNNKIDFIQFEFGAANYLSKTYLFDFYQLLTPNYKLYRLLRNGVIEINNYNTDLEIHILCNYIAVSRGISKSPF